MREGGEGPKEEPSPLGMSPPKVRKTNSTALTPLPEPGKTFPAGLYLLRHRSEARLECT